MNNAVQLENVTPVGIHSHQPGRRLPSPPKTMDEPAPPRQRSQERDLDVVMDSVNEDANVREPSQPPETSSGPAVDGSANAPLPPPTQLAPPTILPPLPVGNSYARSASVLAGAPGSLPGTPVPVAYGEPGLTTPGGAPLPPSQTPTSPGASGRPLNVKDALSYLELVKVKFENWPDVYNQFLDIMKDFKSQVIDTPGVIARVSGLFSSHPALIQGFNTFLPAGYRIECTECEDGGTDVTVTTPSGTTTTHTAPRERSPNEPGFPPSGGPQANQPLPAIPWAAGPNQVMGGLPLTPNGLQPNPFEAAAPPPPQNNKMPQAGQGAEFNHAIQFVNTIKHRFSQDPDTYKQFLEILQKYQKEQRPYQEVFHQVSALFQGAPDLIEEFKQFLPDPTSSNPSANNGLFGVLAGAGEIGRGEMDRERLDKKKATSAAADKATGQKRKKRGHEEKPVPPAKVVQPPKAKRTKHTHGGKPEPQSPTYAPSPLPSHAVPNGPHHLPHATNGVSSKHVNPKDENLFFERIKKHFDDRNKYHDFLKLLNLFTQEIIGARTLVERATFFLTDPELLQQFKDIMGYDDRDVVIEPDSGLRGNSTVIAALDRPKVDLNTCRKYGPSYRKLPKEEVSLACSGRDAMCWEVLNDEWVSHPTWASEDTGFTTHKKNVFEEALHKSEEERHEYDFHVEAITRTIHILEPIMGRINLMDNDERTHFKLKPGLGGQGKSIYQRVIKKVYGKDHGLEIITALHESPSIAVPVVLNRLKQKDDEWRRAQREWNKVWREVDGRNYYKSLDHQGVNFKANDKKAWTPKNLVQEIEAKRQEQTKERAKLVDPLFARTQPKDHYAFKIEDIGVLQDCIKLILVFLDRTTTAQYSRTDKMHVEGFLHAFIPLFFMVDPTEYMAAFQPAAAVRTTAPVTPRAGDEEPSDDGASDSVMEEAGDDSASVATTSAAGRKGGKKAAGGVAGADLRKKLLKSGAQAKSAKSSHPPSRASPAPGHLGEAMAVDGEVFATAESDSWVKYTSTDPLATKHSVFKPRASDVPGRKSNFFANNHIYVLLRQLQTLYSRLHTCKTIAAELAADDSGWHLANPIAVQLGFHDTIGAGNTRLLTSGPNPAKEFYGFTLACCEQLFDSQMEPSVFEDNIRFMYDIKAYIMFTIDKLVAATVKQVQTVISDSRSQDLITLLRKERALETFTTQQLINYRREAEAITGPEENLYRVCWIVPTSIMQVQLLGRDDISTDDAKTLTDRWRQYIETYTLPHQTEGLPDEVQPPFLRRSLEEHEDESAAPTYISRAGLQIKICIRTYRLFFVSGTEDFYWRTQTSTSKEEVAKNATDRRVERRATFQRWLDRQVPSSTTEASVGSENVDKASEA
ncbi:hypothetical protein DL93DRAFT_2070048 [Clavulina sp. PMI_390]|nr:hypothetical protein DL93DRAFT_2070048 [Clavulina sp. PMI_390]